MQLSTLFIRSDEENAKAAFRALIGFGVPMQGLSSADFFDGTTFQIGQPPDRIDILQRIDGVTFDEAWPNRIEGLIGWRGTRQRDLKRRPDP